MQQTKVKGARWAAFGLVLLWAASIAIGCGGATTAKVTGTVKYKGEGLPSGTINFIGTEGTVLGSGQIQDDGSYTVEAAPIGECKITVVTEASQPPEGKGPLSLDKPNKQLKEAPKDNDKHPDAKDERERQMKKVKDGAPGLSGQKRVVPAPSKYRSPESTPLKYTVKHSKNVYDFELSD